MEVLCINDTFSPDQLAFWAKHGIKHPIKDKIYHVAGMTRHTTGEISLYLSELEGNPLVPIQHPILGVRMMKVGFNIKRFTTLLGAPVEYEKIKTSVPN